MTLLYDVANGEAFDLFLLLKAADQRTASNGNPFIAMQFQDESGTMDGMYWSATPEEVATFQAGRVVRVRGQRDTYRGKPQVRIRQIRLATDEEPNDPTLYVERLDVSRSELKDQLEEALTFIEEPHILQVVKHILNQAGEDFYTYPAAKRFHHAIAGGLSYHTLTMVQIAKSLLTIYPSLNASLLMGGIILHDIGKTIELTDAVSTEYTLKGQLVGHIVIMVELIEEACRELGIDSDSEPILLLKHVVLAHHGKLEYGSPVTPRVLEAEIIHQIDMMDANINMMTTELDKTDAGEFSAPIFALERRSFYKPRFK